MDDDESLIEHIVKEEPDNPFDELNLILDVRNALKKLSAYDALLLHFTCECQLSLSEIGERVGLTKQRVHKQLQSALSRLRKDLDS